MRTYTIALALALVPSTAFGQNFSSVMQLGWDNQQVTQQIGGTSGFNTSTTVQIGSDNTASTTQTGGFNSSTIVQTGSGQTQTSVQTGYQGYSSVQGTSRNYSVSRTMTAGGGTITMHVEINGVDPLAAAPN